MIDQLALPMGEFRQSVDQPRTLGERFASFHEANPWVADALEHLADDLVRHGASKIGIKHLVEVLRWHHTRETYGDPFRFNNSYTSRYARLLVRRRPDLAPMIETRTLR